MDPILSQLEDAITRSIVDLDEAAMQSRPGLSDGKWSIEQIVEHLSLTYGATATALEARLAKGTPTQARASVTQRLAQFMITQCGLFPSGRRAPDGVTPVTTQEHRSGPELCKIIHERLARMDQLLEETRAMFGNKQAVNHMVLGPLSVHQWKRFHLIHGLHHVKQILSIRKANQL